VHNKFLKQCLSGIEKAAAKVVLKAMEKTRGIKPIVFYC